MNAQTVKPAGSKVQTCPKCGFDQVASPECPRCGLVLAKYLTPQQRAEFSARHLAVPDKPKPKSRTPLVLGAVGAAVLVGLVVTVFVVRGLLDRDPPFLAEWLQGHAGHEKARSLQAESPRFMLVYFDRPDCARCGEFASGPLADPKVQEEVANAVRVHVRVTADSDEVPLSVDFGVTSFPALYLVAGTARQEIPVTVVSSAGARLRNAEELVAAMAEARQVQGGPMALAAGKKALEAGQHAQALQEFERALEASPNSTEALRGRGMARSAVGDTARALRDFASWARLDPDNLEAHRMAAEAALKVDRLDDALASVDRLIERQPEYEKGRAFQLRASIHVKRGSFEKALDDARRACDLGNVEGCKVIKDNRRTQEPAAPRKKGAKR